MNQLYPKAKEKFLTGALDWLSDTIKVAFLDSTYAYSSAHEFLSSVSGIVHTSAALTGKTAASGVADASDISASPSGAQVTRLLLFVDTGSAATSSLLVYIDTGYGLPFTPDGGARTIEWDNGASKIFAL